MHQKTRNITTTIPASWDEPIVNRLVQLDVTRSKYIKDLIRRDLNLASESTHAAPKSLSGKKYAVGFEISKEANRLLSALAEQKSVARASIAMTILYKTIPNLPVRPDISPIIRDVWRTATPTGSGRHRLHLHIPIEWEKVVDKYSSNERQSRVFKKIIYEFLGIKEDTSWMDIVPPQE